MKSVIELTLKLVLAKQNNKVLEQESCQFGLFKSCKRKKKRKKKRETFFRLSMFVCRKTCFCLDCADLFLL